jgi:hypothetical protein
MVLLAYRGVGFLTSRVADLPVRCHSHAMIDPFINQTAADFSITDDAYIRWFIAEHKLLAEFHAGPFSKPTMQYHRFFGHPAYWIVIRRFDGHVSPGDNGYVMDCFSKSDYSKEDLAGYYQHLDSFHSVRDKRVFKPKLESN